MTSKSRLAFGLLIAAFGIVVGVAGASAVASDAAGPDHAAQGCSELAKTDSTNRELDRLYDPTTGDLTVYGEDGAYAFNVKDPSCLQYPDVKSLVDDVLSVYQTNQREECEGITQELKSLDPDLLARRGAKMESAKGTVDLDALMRYGEEVCGGKIEGIPHS